MSCCVTNYKLYPLETTPDISKAQKWTSNGGMDVIVCAMALAASDIAVSDWEKRFASWISYNSSIRGAGVACWDIDDIAWTRDDFDVQKAFVLRVLDMSLAHHRWDVFSITPNIPAIDDMLRGVREFVDGYYIAFVEPNREAHFGLGDHCIKIKDRCPRHNIYLNSAGCALEYLSMVD